MNATKPRREAETRSRINWPILVVGLTIVGGLVALLGSGFGNDPHALPDMRTGTQAVPWKLTDLDGKEWSLDELRGKPVVVNFWSTWCGPCKYEHPLLLQAAREVPSVTFLGVIYSDDPSAVKRYLKAAGSAYPHLVDPDGRTAIDYGVGGVPETFFIDRDGLIAYKHVGPLDPPTLKGMLERIVKP